MSKYCKPMGLYVTYMDCLECEGKECMDKTGKPLKTQNTREGTKRVLKRGDVFRIKYEDGIESPLLCYLGTVKSSRGTRLIHQRSETVSNGIFLILKDDSLKGKQIRVITNNEWWKNLRKQYEKSVICW